MNPRISVSITCFNHARFIRQCVDSVLAQSYPAADIHVIDDCSTDGSLDILRSYGTSIRLTERSENQGVAGYTGTINHEIKTAPGDFWYRLDSDDFIAPTYFEEMVNALRKEPTLDWICGGLSVVDAEGRVTDQWDYTGWATERTMALKRAWQTCSVPLPHNGIFRLAFLRQHKLFWECFPFGWGADVLFTIRALQSGVRAKLIPGSLFNWRTHGNNASCDIDRRVGLVLAVKEYFAEYIEPEIYLNLPSNKTLLESDRAALTRLLQADDLLQAKRQFRIPAMFSNFETARLVHKALPQFDPLIEKWLQDASTSGHRFLPEVSRIQKTLVASKEWVDGEVEFDSGNLSAALQRSQDALSHDPIFFEAERLRTDVLVGLQDSRAEESITQLVAKAPYDQRILNTAGVFLAGCGESEQAFAVLQKSVTNGPAVEPRLNLLELLPEISGQRLLAGEEKRAVLESMMLVADRCDQSERSSLVAEQQRLRQSCLDTYAQRHRDNGIRILLHLPPNGALKYLFQSWADMLNHMGITTMLLPWGFPVQIALDQFLPTVFISVADPFYAEQIDLNQLATYRRSHGLQVGWVTTLSHNFQPCDFYLTFHLDPTREPDFLTLDKPLISVPFAANPLRHIAHDLPVLWDYFFVGTNSQNKFTETAAYLNPILRNYRGVLAGVGWQNGLGEVSVEDAALCYQTARVLPNFHMQGQLDRFNELNERCYIIPALGCFQIVDRAKALKSLFAPDEMIVADSEKEYHRLFDYYLNRPDEREAVARLGMQRVWRDYTLGHVLDRLAMFLLELPRLSARGSRAEIVKG